MQLRKMTLMLAALGTMSLVLTGCPDGGRESLTCTENADCLESEICHPDAKVCVQTCPGGTSAECPDSAKICETISATNTTNICKCSTSALCAQDDRVTDVELVCDTANTEVCVPKCSADTDCATGQTCDTTSGICKAGSTTGQTCSGEGKSTCSYGEFCSSNTCAAVPAPTCENYQNFTRRNELGTTGPITFKAVTTSAAVDSFCGTGTNRKRVRVTVSAYSSTPFPQTKDELNGLFYVQVAGTTVDGPDIISSSSGNYTVTGTNRERADFIMSFCVAETSSTLSIGVYFTSGNFFCYQANY